MWAIRRPTSVGVKEFTRALAGAFGKFPQEEFVGAAKKIGLNVGKSQAVARIGEGFDDLGEFRRVDIAFSIALGGEIYKVNDARERGVISHDGADRFCQVLANILRACASPLVIRPIITLSPIYDSPSRLGWQVEAQQAMVQTQRSPWLSAWSPYSSARRSISSSKTSDRRLRKRRGSR